MATLQFPVTMEPQEPSFLEGKDGPCPLVLYNEGAKELWVEVAASPLLPPTLGRVLVLPPGRLRIPAGGAVAANLLALFDSTDSRSKLKHKDLVRIKVFEAADGELVAEQPVDVVVWCAQQGHLEPYPRAQMLAELAAKGNFPMRWTVSDESPPSPCSDFSEPADKTPADN